MSHRKIPYEFRYEGREASQRIYASFYDYYHRRCEVQVSEVEHQELVLINRSIRNLESTEERHNEFCELSEEEQTERGVPTYLSAEEEVMHSLLAEELKAAFLAIPAVQARRYLLAHGCGYSYAEIARMEGCSVQAVNKSLMAAKKKLQEILRNRVIETPSKFGSK